MNTRLEIILASEFWRDAEPMSEIEEVALGITGREGEYHWYFIDKRYPNYLKSGQSFGTVRAAKDDLQQHVQKLMSI